jgi:uncharacterized membrane protein (UPF0136 family)
MNLGSNHRNIQRSNFSAVCLLQPNFQLLAKFLQMMFVNILRCAKPNEQLPSIWGRESFRRFFHFGYRTHASSVQILMSKFKYEIATETKVVFNLTEIMSHTAVTILWVYIVLLFIGGVMGLVKAGSKISLVTSSIFAVLLALCALGIITPSYIADILVGLLLVVFGVRFAKGRKFMPSGLMLALSAAMLAVLLFVH